MANRAGLAARVQGMTRHYSLELVPGTGVVLRATVDDAPEVLAAVPAEIAADERWDLSLRVEGKHITGTARRVDGREFTVEATDERLTSGAIGLLCDTGRSDTMRVDLRPI